ncbi:MAG: hypothetical protein IIW72_02915 [Clostridia bacterium]|nr:hypothetical protein [Clostridia bacterium]
MEQNNFNNQEVTKKREPLPTFNEEPIDNVSAKYDTLPKLVFQEEKPNFVQEQAPNQEALEELQKYANLALGKSIPAVIMSQFPILSLIAISMGDEAVVLADTAITLANEHKISIGAKAIVAKILGMVGKYNGALCSLIWFICVVLIIFNL